MLKSMTGYGEAATEREAFSLSVEVRSVNQRFLKVTSKTPEEISSIQTDLEAVIRQRIDRGAVHFTVRFEPRSAADLYEIDEELLRKYVTQVEHLQREIDRVDDRIGLRDLLLLPGVVRTQETLRLGRDDLRPAAVEAMEEAVGQVVEMREAEGQSLDADLRARHGNLTSLLARVQEVAPRAVEDLHAKIDQRLQQLLGEHRKSLTHEDVVKEVALLAERSDIAEEVSRMDSHLRQFREALDQKGPVGRKLEFIVQEMLRESNTMGAKAGNGELSLLIVEMKADIDRMREQVANVE